MANAANGFSVALLGAFHNRGFNIVSIIWLQFKLGLYLSVGGTHCECYFKCDSLVKIPWN